MKIVICSKCGKMIHKSTKCLYCGNDSEFQDISVPTEIHENVITEYEQLFNFLNAGKFSSMLELSRYVLEWMPTCSEVFWMRMLAKNKCKNDAELVQKGIEYDESADFYNAMQYASSDEKTVYQQIKQLIDLIKNGLEKAVIRHEYEEKALTPILKYQKEIFDEINERRKKLFILCSDLGKVEQDMNCVEQECKMLINEHKSALDKAASEADYVKTEISKLTECTEEELHKFHVQLGSILNQSDQSKNAIEVMRKQHPWIDKFSELVRERDEIIDKISLELSSLKAYENEIQSTVSEIEGIEKKHQGALRALSHYDFQSTYSLLGEKKYEEALTSVGLAVISPISK